MEIKERILLFFDVKKAMAGMPLPCKIPRGAFQQLICRRLQIPASIVVKKIINEILKRKGYKLVTVNGWKIYSKPYKFKRWGRKGSFRERFRYVSSVVDE